MTTSACILGLGSIGLRHARNLLALGVVVRGFDPSKTARAALRASGGDAYRDLRSALDGADLAVVASPSGRHHKDIRTVLQAGCHVMVEKPFATRTEGLMELLDSAERAGQLIFPAHNLRVHPAVRRLRKLLAAGRLGEVNWVRMLGASYLPVWRPGSDHRLNYAADRASGGVIFDFIHELDLAWHLFGPYHVIACTARSSGRIGIAADDCADLLLEHESGVVCNVHLDYLTRPPRRLLELGTTMGTVVVDILARSLEIWEVDGTSSTTEAFGGQHADDYVTEAELFIAATVGQGQSLPCTWREALAVLGEVKRARRLADLPEA